MGRRRIDTRVVLQAAGEEGEKAGQKAEASQEAAGGGRGGGWERQGKKGG